MSKRKLIGFCEILNAAAIVGILAIVAILAMAQDDYPRRPRCTSPPSEWPCIRSDGRIWRPPARVDEDQPLEIPDSRPKDRRIQATAPGWDGEPVEHSRDDYAGMILFLAALAAGAAALYHTRTEND